MSEGASPAEMRVDHRPRLTAHLGDLVRLVEQPEQKIGEAGAIARFDHGPAAMAPDDACDVAVTGGNRDNRATGRGDAVELAGHDQRGR